VKRAKFPFHGCEKEALSDNSDKRLFFLFFGNSVDNSTERNCEQRFLVYPV